MWYFYYTDVPFEMSYLELLKKGNQNPPQRLRVIERICLKWRDMGTLLGVDHAALGVIKNERQGAKDCCYGILEKWFDNGSKRYPLDWGGMLELLDDLEMSGVAKELREMISVP